MCCSGRWTDEQRGDRCGERLRGQLGRTIERNRRRGTEGLVESRRAGAGRGRKFLLAGVGVNVMLFLAFLLSGFFALPGRWIKALLVLFIGFHTSLTGS